MLKGKKVIVVMPAYNAEKTLARTHAEVLAQEVVDEVVVVDDASTDNTAAVARTLPKTTLRVHGENRGYGANQKTCYRAALDRGGDVVVMVHADYQYSPALIGAMASMVADGGFACVLGSRVLGGGALSSGMPLWKYAANRGLTLVQNLATGARLSEYHTGYRAFSRELLLDLPLSSYSDGFAFDAQMLAHALWKGYAVGEVPCPARYHPDASVIGLGPSILYGLACLRICARFYLARKGLTGFSV
ncbi:MAG: glycosyltransferase family 2 protein [Deltaproteobacteria bacterium]|nr:glycosyltransferase family 2 protein [Deltaproteobacteria bacterium]